VWLTTHLHLVPRLGMDGGIILLLYVFKAWGGTFLFFAFDILRLEN